MTSSTVSLGSGSGKRSAVRSRKLFTASAHVACVPGTLSVPTTGADGSCGKYESSFVVGVLSAFFGPASTGSPSDFGAFRGGFFGGLGGPSSGGFGGFQSGTSADPRQIHRLNFSRKRGSRE